MESLITSTTSLPISTRTTVEDVLNFTKKVIQDFLRANQMKISGSKLALAQRVVDTIRSRCDLAEPVSCETDDSSSDPRTEDVPDISELKSGWTATSSKFLTVTITDIE